VDEFVSAPSNKIGGAVGGGVGGYDDLQFEDDDEEDDGASTTG
jgi:hypothetical protein